MKARLIAIAVLSSSLCGCASAASPLRVPAQDLPVRKNQLLQSTVAVQGCLSDSRHGAYIRPCDSTDPQFITLLSDPMDKIPEIFVSELGHLGGDLQVTVVGLLVRINDSAPRGGQQIYLEVQSITPAGGHEP